LLPLLHNDKAKAIEIAHNEIDLYEKRFQVYWREGLENIPSVYPRNHNVQAALDNAENGDFTLFNSLLTALQNPYQYSPEFSPPPNENRPYVTFCGT